MKPFSPSRLVDFRLREFAAADSFEELTMHTCPDCGQACYCNGDFDDHENEDEADDCVHCDDEEDDL